MEESNINVNKPFLKEDLYKILEEHDYSKPASKSLKEFNNWAFGISLGICYFLIVYIDDAKFIIMIKIAYLFVLIFSFLNCMFAGICRYLIFEREINMGIREAVFNKHLLIGKQENKTKEEIKNKGNLIIIDWMKEYNKLKRNTNLINISNIICLKTILFLAEFIILIKIVR
jgi:hypothetical protein